MTSLPGSTMGAQCEDVLPANEAVLDLSAHASTTAAGRPVALPLTAPLSDFALDLAFLRAAAQWCLAHCPVKRLQGIGIGLRNPHVVARLIGERLTTRVATRLDRPACAFAKAHLWCYERGDTNPPHADHPGLDITMSVPLALAGAKAWPLHMRQPSGDVVQWSVEPGTVLLFDGRWRRHWRGPLDGDHAWVLLLHWRAPAVRWRGMLTARECAGLLARGHGRAAWASTLDRCADLAKLAVPPSEAPALTLHRGDFPLRQSEGAQSGRGVRLLAPLDGELAVTFNTFDPVVLDPGDGLAFPAREECRLHWRTLGGIRTVLTGQGRLARAKASP